MIRLALVLCALAAPAFAASDCAEAGQMLDRLKSEYGEVFAFGGIENLGGATLITVNPRTGSYSVLHGEGGALCLIGAGTGWQGKGDAL